MKVWNYESQECIRTIDEVHTSEINFISITHDYKYVMTIDKSRRAKMNIFSLEEDLK